MYQERIHRYAKLLKNYFQRRSDIELDREEILILASTIAEPLTMAEICYTTKVSLTVCVAKARKLVEMGLLNLYDPKSPIGKKCGRLFVYRISRDLISDLKAFRSKR